MHVREGVRWDDGVPVTAEDVKFSLELWTNPEVAVPPDQDGLLADVSGTP